MRLNSAPTCSVQPIRWTMYVATPQKGMQYAASCIEQKPLDLAGVGDTLWHVLHASTSTNSSWSTGQDLLAHPLPTFMVMPDTYVH